MVLVALIEMPFEPLHQATPRDLMLKVLFLLAATSARTVSEIHGLCIDSSLSYSEPTVVSSSTEPVVLA